MPRCPDEGRPINLSLSTCVAALCSLGGTKWRDGRVVQPVRWINLDSLVWQKRLIEMPTNLAGMRSASALVGGRFVFMIAGQVGGRVQGSSVAHDGRGWLCMRGAASHHASRHVQPAELHQPRGPLLQTDSACAPANAAVYRLDLSSMELETVPSLPQPRWVGLTGSDAVPLPNC